MSVLLHSLLDRRRLVVAVRASLALLLIAAILAAAPAPRSRPESRPQPSPDSAATAPKWVVVIVLDGCRADYLSLAPMPNLEALERRGTTFDCAWLGQLISNTPPSHATLGTGCFPRRHGIVGFFWMDPASGKVCRPTSLEPVVRGQLTNLFRRSSVPSFLSLLRAKRAASDDDASLVRACSISSNKYYAAAAMGGRDAATIVFAMPEGSDLTQQSEEAVEEGPDSSLRVTPGTLSGRSLPERVLEDPALKSVTYEHCGDVNAWAMTAALDLVSENPCDVLYLNLPETDEVGHRTGGARDAEREVMKGVDAQIGRLISEIKRQGRFEQTVFVVTADHGMVANRIDARFPTLDELEQTLPRADRAERLAQLSAGFALEQPPYFWIRNPDDAETFAESITRTRGEGFLGAFYKKRHPDGTFEYLPAPTTRREIRPERIEAYRYLFSTFACPNGPHVVLVTEEGVLFGRQRVGTHGGHMPVTWDVQHIPMILSGPGIRAGVVSHAPARLVDVAPTLARLFGCDPSAMDGVPIADALESPSAEDESRCAEAYKEFPRHQKALREPAIERPLPAPH